MEAVMEKLEAQLKLWGVNIDHLAAKTQVAGTRAGFDNVVYIDELKALRAIAQSKLDEFKAAKDAERARLMSEMESTWHELDAALKKAKPSP